MIRKTMLLGPMLLAAGCMKTTITTGAPAGAASDHKARFFLYGLIGLPAIVYNPGTVKVWCRSGSAYKAELSEQGDLLSMTQVD